QEIGKNEDREAFLFCPNSHYSGKKTDYQTNKQKKTNIKRDVCLHSEHRRGAFLLQKRKEM
ncbi:MAG: hypothetical protein SPE83_04190, partial [Streptococcus suis]|nr:hypothetical protein [Streptococcus suis]MDY5054495.1 hypothetical protein [Streptococcus suis]